MIKHSRPMRYAFTLVELMVVIAIIGLLMAILSASVGKARKLARTSACAANLRQWTLAWQMYAQENNDWTMPSYWGNISGTRGQFTWLGQLSPYIKISIDKARLCPETGNRVGPGPDKYTQYWGTIDTYWQIPTQDDILGNGTVSKLSHSGAYGYNAWRWSNGAGPNNTAPVAPKITSAQPVNMPVFFDSQWTDVKPTPADTLWPTPYDYSGYAYSKAQAKNSVPSTAPQITRVCINRHGGAINVSQPDGSVVRVRLPDLWNLPWYGDTWASPTPAYSPTPTSPPFPGS